MIRPPYLQTGDCVAIVSTARKISQEELRVPIQIIESWGLKVKLAPGLFECDNQFAGSDQNRIQDFEWALKDKEVKAVLCARGGYGTVRIIDSIDFQLLLDHPKWIVGYSDATVLHSHLNAVLRMESIHATMPISFSTNSAESLSSLKHALFGELNEYNLDMCQIVVSGEARGELVGGNLSILCSLMGSRSQLKTKNKILFIEDIDEMLYHIDRMLINLKRAKVFDELSGLIVGGMTDMRDNTISEGFSTDNPYGHNPMEILVNSLEEYNFPICWNFPAGHNKDNRAIYLGRQVSCNFDSRLDIDFNK